VESTPEVGLYTKNFLEEELILSPSIIPSVKMYVPLLRAETFNVPISMALLTLRFFFLFVVYYFVIHCIANGSNDRLFATSGTGLGAIAYIYMMWRPFNVSVIPPSAASEIDRLEQNFDALMDAHDHEFESVSIPAGSTVSRAASMPVNRLTSRR